MIRAASALLRPPRPVARRNPHPDRQPHPSVEPSFTYDRPFWLTYMSNSLLMMAVALLFRYADFVTLLGGNEFHLGWIVGVGMVGSLLTRLALGSCIDRYGARRVWLGSTLLFVATCFAHLAVASHTGVAIYLLRISYCCAMAGVYGASMTFISSRCRHERMAELVAMLGTAGFLGTVLGTLLGDVLFGSVTVDRTHVSLMFVAAGLTGMLSLPFAWAARGRKCGRRPPPVRPCWSVLRQHYSGAGAGGGRGDGTGVDAAQHVSTHLRRRTRHPAHRTVLPGLCHRRHRYAGGRPALVRAIRHPADHFVGHRRPGGQPGPVPAGQCRVAVALPAIGFGGAHAMVFPAIVAAGSLSFPARHRGLAILLVLAAWDVGQLIGARWPGPCCATAKRPGCRPIRPCFSPWRACWPWSALVCGHKPAGRGELADTRWGGSCTADPPRRNRDGSTTAIPT